jgi:membrane fusion protein, multidrug efflux system
MSLPRSIAVLLALALCACASSCSEGGAQPSTQGGPQSESADLKKREPARVRTAAIEQREMVRTLSTTTVVESEREIKVFPRASGVVTHMNVEEGDRVEAGAVLAVLDRRSQQAMIDEARVALKEAEDNVLKADIQKAEADARIAQSLLKYEQCVRDYERNERANLISAQQLDNLRVLRDSALSDHESFKLASERATIEMRSVRTALEKAALVLKRQELEDSYMSITAPFAGTIATRSVKIGDSVSAGAPAFVLTDPTNLRAVIHRPQRELAMFLRAAGGASDSKAEIEIRAKAEALPERMFRGEIMRVSPSIDPQSGSFRVTIRLFSSSADAQSGDTQSGELLPGMLVRIEIVTDRHPNALTVPKRALRREGEENLVFIVTDGRAQRVSVEEGFSDDDSVEIIARTHALAPGQRVVVVGNRELEDGAEVAEEALKVPGENVQEPAAASEATDEKKG